MEVDISCFSSHYSVRSLTSDDLEEIYALCSKNGLYYRYCPPYVTDQSIIDDMNALPPGKEMDDKYYLGYFDRDKLVAVMDFIASFPYEKVAFIGFFMTEVSIQNKGVGSSIIDELCVYLRSVGFSRVRLGWVKGNPQAEYFWHKNGFVETGITRNTSGYTVVIGERVL